MATDAVGRGRDMRGGFPASAASVVTAHAISGCSEPAVIDPCPGPRIHTVASAAIGRGCQMVAGLAACHCAVVATRTVGRDRKPAVIYFRAGPGGGAVATGAIGIGRDVIGGLAAGVGSVVAAGAVCGCGKSAVIDLRASPGRRLVAVFATDHTGMNRRGRLANGWRKAATVAAGALRSRSDIAVKARLREALCVVARLAARLRRNVIDRFDGVGAGNSQTAGMAAGAIFGCAFEHARDMARLTTLGRMHAGQRKSGFQMVKIAKGRLCKCLTAQQHKHQRQRIPKQPRQMA